VEALLEAELCIRTILILRLSNQDGFISKVRFILVMSWQMARDQVRVDLCEFVDRPFF